MTRVLYLIKAEFEALVYETVSQEASKTLVICDSCGKVNDKKYRTFTLPLIRHQMRIKRAHGNIVHLCVKCYRKWKRDHG